MMSFVKSAQFLRNKVLPGQHKFVRNYWQTFLNFEETHYGTVSKKKKKLMEFSIKGPDPASQPLNGKKNKIKHGLKML